MQMQSVRKTELKRPVPASKWPDVFLSQELVTLTGGIIGRPTAYAISKELGRKYGKAMVIPKIKFFEWFLGMDNIYVQVMKRDAEKWTKE